MIKSASASELPAGAFADRTKLKEAVDEWVRDAVAAKATHGPISGWDVSRVDDMSGRGNPYYEGFFRGAFDSQIGGWDTSKVRNMAYTFYDAKAFNSELAWDTSQVTNMYRTFYLAEAFNSELAWDTSQVTNMADTFYYAEAFNQDHDEGDNDRLTACFDFWNLNKPGYEL